MERKRRLIINRTIFEMIILIPVFFSNFLVVFYLSTFAQNKMFVPTIVFIDVAMIVIFYLNFKDRLRYNNRIYYIIIITFLIISLLGSLQSYLYK